jgi:DNA polymerase III alpha subunit
MLTNKFGQIVLNEIDLIDLYYNNPDIKIKKVLCEKSISFDSILELSDYPKITAYEPITLDVETFDRNNQNNWLMPSEYKDLDIAQYILDQCKTDSELQRAGQELLLFQERDMFDLLKYLKYLVDTMRKHNIVWGVGRGSSVASFVLYLLGVHKINSLYYDLSIDEFLK